MGIQVESSFLVPAPIEEAWKLLTDVPRIVPCMPGAEITEVIDERTFKGVAKVKVGPIQLQFQGQAQLHDLDPVAHRSNMSARASDAKGRGNMQSEMTFSMAAEGDQTRVDVLTDLTLTGSVAQYGRGAGLIKEIANQFTRQFAANLAAQLSGTATPDAAKPVSGIGMLSSAVGAMIKNKLGGGEGSPPADK